MNSLPQTEELRPLQSLREMGILDVPAEQEHDELVQLAAEICQVPISVISLMDETSFRVQAAVGMPLSGVPRDCSFCTAAIQSAEMFLVEDAAADSRFASHPMVVDEPAIRFYCGVPLFLAEGMPIGALCVIDTVPRSLSAGQRKSLSILARQVRTRLQMRAQQRLLEISLAKNRSIAAGLRASEARFRAFMNQSPFASYIKDADGRMLYYNRQLAERYGVTQEAWLGRTDHELWPQEMADQFRRHDVSVLEGGRPVELAEKSPSPDGSSSTYWKSYKFPYTDVEGRVLLAGVSVDVTADLERERALETALRDKEKLADSQTLFRRFMDHSPCHSWLKSEDGRYMSYNRAFAQYHGIGATDWVGLSDRDVLPAEMGDEFWRHDQVALASDAPFVVEAQVPGEDGAVRHFRALKFCYTDAQGVKVLAGVALDVTAELAQKAELERANDQLKQLATTDGLTGLSNRRAFDHQLDAGFSQAKRRNRSLAVILADVDDFKKRNDRYGREAGDSVLRRIGELLRKTVRETDVAVRYGAKSSPFCSPIRVSRTLFSLPSACALLSPKTPGSTRGLPSAWV